MWKLTKLVQNKSENNQYQESIINKFYIDLFFCQRYSFRPFFEPIKK